MAVTHLDNQRTLWKEEPLSQEAGLYYPKFCNSPSEHSDDPEKGIAYALKEAKILILYPEVAYGQEIITQWMCTHNYAVLSNVYIGSYLSCIYYTVFLYEYMVPNVQWEECHSKHNWIQKHNAKNQHWGRYKLAKHLHGNEPHQHDWQPKSILTPCWTF